MKSLLITNKILNWYDINKRSLPWRIKTSAKKKQYYTLVSEFMLQQTQVATVIPYFNRFIKNIPDLETLAEFQDQKLIKLWEGLGYYSRVKNLNDLTIIFEGQNEKKRFFKIDLHFTKKNGKTLNTEKISSKKLTQVVLKDPTNGNLIIVKL